jgi:hypothetical protein
MATARERTIRRLKLKIFLISILSPILSPILGVIRHLKLKIFLISILSSIAAVLITAVKLVIVAAIYAVPVWFLWLWVGVKFLALPKIGYIDAIGVAGVLVLIDFIFYHPRKD